MVEKVLRNIKNGYPRTFKLKHDDNILFKELVGIKRQARANKKEAEQSLQRADTKLLGNITIGKFNFNIITNKEEHLESRNLFTECLQIKTSNMEVTQKLVTSLLSLGVLNSGTLEPTYLLKDIFYKIYEILIQNDFGKKRQQKINLLPKKY